MQNFKYNEIQLNNFAWSAEEFKKDAMGKPLRYKILFKNEKVFAVLYNNGERIERLKHQEFKVGGKNPTLMCFKASEITSEFSHSGDLYGFVTNCPVTTMTCKDKKE